MREIDVKLSIGYPTAICEDTLRVNDDATDAEIEELVEEWAWEHIDWSWKEVK